MATLHSHRGGAQALPLPAMLATIPSLPRPVLSRLVARMIDRIDELDGDTDIEANGDELDGSMAEDDFHAQNHNWRGEPGCPVSDPDSCITDVPHDRAEEGDFELDGARNWPKPRYDIDQRVVLNEMSRITGMGLDVDTMRDRRV